MRVALAGKEPPPDDADGNVLTNTSLRRTNTTSPTAFGVFGSHSLDQRPVKSQRPDAAGL